MNLHFHPMVNLSPDFDIAVTLLQLFLASDPHYQASSSIYGHKAGDEAVRGAVNLFLRYPQNGKVVLGFDETKAVSVCILNYAISTSTGSWVAKLDDVFVIPEYQGKGVGTAMLDYVKDVLLADGFSRIDCSFHKKNKAAAKFYAKVGFKPLNEEKISCLLSSTE